MKRYTFLLSLLLCSSLLCAQTPLQKQLEALPYVVKVEKIDNTAGFAEKYLLRMEQPLDHARPQLGTFTQRVFVMHKGADRPTVMVTEGYGAAYAASPRHQNELSQILEANLVVVEHRYFLESTPQPLNWDYLTAENSAYDLHRVNQALKNVYTKKWLSTGISKGGQTTYLYRAYFPDDVDVSVPYVGPLCWDVEDGRHEPFLRNFAGTTQERKAILDFQMEVLKRRAQLMPLFEALCDKDNFKFNLPLEEIYDYSLLEYPFAFWQWGTPVATIPALSATDQEIFDHWMRISGPSYFVNESGNTAFFVQAARELGYYGYDTEPYKELLKIKSSKGYLAKLFLPESLKDTKFNPALYHKIERFMATTDAKMVIVYGEYDPWSAPAVSNPHSDNILYLVGPKGSHRARINNLPEDMKTRAIETLKAWMLD
jgi:PS-10 peptidase S37.